MQMAKMSLSDAVGIMYSPPNICGNENQQQQPPSNYIHQNPIFKCVCMLFNINKTFSKHIVIKFIKNTLLANRFIYRKNKEGLILTINVFFKQ